MAGDPEDDARTGTTRLARSRRAALITTLGSPVTRSIAFWVLASIVVIEFVILVPSIFGRQDEIVAAIDDRNRYAARAAIAMDRDDPATAIATLPEVIGVAVYAPGGARLGAAGEPVAAPGSGMMGGGYPRLQGDHVIAAWPIETAQGPATAMVRLAAAEIGSDLVQFGLRIIGLVFVIAGFVTVVTMVIVGSRVLRPLGRITRAVREARRTGHREYVDPDQPGEFGELVAEYNATISEQQAAEQRGDLLYYQAMHDPLTGLPNRALFADRLTQALERAARYNEKAAVLLLDLDRFKLFNDTHGHAAGDRLLRAVAERVRNTLRNSDTVARIGGDEFAVIQPRVEGDREIERLGERLRSALREPFEIEGRTASLGASVGITLLPDEGADADTLIVNADLAMYQAKHEGGDRVRRFRDDLRDDVVRQVTLEQSLREALEQGQFELHYQPIVRLADDRIVAYEALVRWNHPQSGLVAPNHFLPVVEQSGMMVELGDWVIARALRDLPRLQAVAPDCERVAVNVAADQLAAADADELVTRALAGTGLAAHQVTLEITESAVLRSPEPTIAGLERAARLGATIAIDDFGTGYSSLAQVQDLPGHILKIDRRFVSPLSESRRARELFGAVVGMGRSLGMQVVAEGIETGEQLEIVRASGCDRAQGFLFARPQPLAALQAPGDGSAAGAQSDR